MRLFVSIALAFLLVQGAMAQGSANPKYIVATRSTGGSTQQAFLASLPHQLVAPDEWAIFNPQLQTNLAAIRLNALELQDLLITHRDFIIELDQQMTPAADCVDPDPLPTGWALQSLLADLPCGLPGPPNGMPNRVTLYVVDSGVQKLISGVPHAQFGAGSPVVWGSGLMSPSLTGSGASPLIDLHNHGTGVASTAVGKDTGLFSHLDGGSVQLESCQIYFPSISPPSAPWVSDAVNVIFLASVQHLARVADACPTNDGSVLIFANRTATGYSEIMERQLAEAAKAGIVVVSSAGNSYSKDDPETPPASTPILACPPFTSISSIAPIPATTRTPSGMPLNATLGDMGFPCLTYATPTTDYLLNVGATTSANQIWFSSASSGSNYGLGTTIFAPGSVVSRASSSSHVISTGTGTSFSAGYVAGMALYYLSIRPWAKVPEVRAFILNHTNTTIDPPVLAKSGMVVHSLDLESLTAPDPCLSFTLWAGLKALVFPDDAKLADPDNDGLANLLEHAVGTNPNSFSANRGLNLIFHDGNYYLQKVLAPYELCDSTVTVEASLDLLTWDQPVPAFLPVAPMGACASKVFEALLGPVPSRKFYRLRVTSP